MATARGKRTGAGKASAAKKGSAKRSAGTKTRKAAKRRSGFLSTPTAGFVMLCLGFLLLFCLWSTSNAVVLVFVRRLLNATFGVIAPIWALLLAAFGLLTLLKDRWNMPRRAWVFGALVALCLATMLQVFRSDDILRSLKAQGYQQNYNGFLWMSYEASRNIPVGGGAMGALLAFPMAKYLDVLGSVLVLFFAAGGLVIALVRTLVPGAGERIGGWWAQIADDIQARREERAEERAARRANEALLVPVPDELLEEEAQEEAPPPLKRPEKGRKAAAPPARPDDAPPPWVQPRAAGPQKKAGHGAAAAPGAAGPLAARPALYIEDILPDKPHSPALDAYTEQDAERFKQKTRAARKDPDGIPDFMAKRRAMYDAAYGAIQNAAEAPADAVGEAMPEPEPYASEDAPLEPLWDDDAPWEPVEPVYEPEAEAPRPTRRRRAYYQGNPLDRPVELDPATRLDRPDWKPPQAPQVTEAVPETEAYRQPPFSLLERDEGIIHADTREQDALGARKLEETLLSFGVTATVIKVVHGPAITRYELQPAPGVKVSKIVNLTDDIALNMAAVGVRIEAPIPGKAAIGIEIANDTIDTVHLRDVLESDESLRHPSRLAVALGKDIAGKRIIADLARMPHLLIAGATGSGKSVCINTLITSIIYRATPEEVRLILVDPKKVELNVYNGIPHLLVPVVTDPKKASGALNWAVMEMDERYRVFADVGVRDIKGYNAQRGKDTPLMPQIVVIIDELSDLMLVAPGEVEDSICRLAQLARACGIHLVIATQRPSVNVITGIIKANIPSRIAFAVSSQVDSRTILDSAGAEKLLGKGDMLYAPAGGGKPLRVQGCFVSDGEVARVVEYVKDRHTVDYSQAVIDALSVDESAEDVSDEDANEAAGDALFQQAVEMAVESGQASISMLQRRLRVGYARAGRLIDEMARRGIIGQAEGAKPREVLITREDFLLMFKKG